MLQVALKSNAVPGERNVLEVETVNIRGDLVRHVIASLCVGIQETATIDIDLWIQEEVTRRLLSLSKMRGIQRIVQSFMKYVFYVCNLARIVCSFSH